MGHKATIHHDYRAERMANRRCKKSLWVSDRNWEGERGETRTECVVKDSRVERRRERGNRRLDLLESRSGAFLLLFFLPAIARNHFSDYVVIGLFIEPFDAFIQILLRFPIVLVLLTLHPPPELSIARKSSLTNSFFSSGC